MRTLIVVAGYLYLLRVPLLLYVWRVHRAYPPAREWALGSMLEGLGYLLVMLRGVAPEALSILGGNALLLSGGILFDIGVARAAGRVPRLWPALPLVVAVTAILTWYTYLEPSVYGRIVAYSLAVCPYRFYAVGVCLRTGQPTLRALAVLSLIQVAVTLWRALSTSGLNSVLMATTPQVMFGFTIFSYVLVNTALVVLLAGQRLQEELAQANRAKSTFLTTMSHELRTPLNGILGFAQILLRDRELSESQRDGVLTIQRSGDHLLTLINDILDLAKVEAGKLEVSQEEFDLPPMLGSLVEMLTLRARAKGLELSLHSQGLPGRVLGDPRRLRQVLLNLLGNAVKFTDSGHVRLQVGAGLNGLCFSVEDTGPGLSAEEMARLFTPFSQFGSASKKAEGTGLGLSISTRLVELMGGQLQAESQPGQGTRFWFEIPMPVAAGPPPVGAARERAGYIGRRRRILVVDDIAANRAICAGLLNPLGFEIEQACEGEQAWASAQLRRPDLILTDLCMAGVGGLELLQRLHQHPELRSVPVVVVSASAYAEDRRACQQAGAVAFLAKPLDREHLLDEVGRHLNLSWSEGREQVSLGGVSAGLWEQLGEAAELGDHQAIEQTLSRVAEHNPELHGRLHALAQQFDFDTILEWVDSARKGESTKC